MLLTQTQLTRGDVVLVRQRLLRLSLSGIQSGSLTAAGHLLQPTLALLPHALSTEITIVFLKTHTDTTHGLLSAPRTKLPSVALKGQISPGLFYHGEVMTTLMQSIGMSGQRLI